MNRSLISRLSLALFTVGLAATSAACAAETEAEEGTEETSALKTIMPSDIVGDVAFDERFHELEVPALGYGEMRALRFHVRAGQRLVAEVATADGTEPKAEVMTESFHTISRQVYTETRTARVMLRAAENGTLLVAFRTKEGDPTRFFVRIATLSSLDTWKTAWPTDGAGKAQVEVTTSDSVSTSNGKGCEFIAESAPSRATPAAKTCTVDTKNGTIMCPTFGYGSVTTRIGTNGTFAFDEHSDASRSDVRLSGEVHPGGLVRISRMSTRSCTTDASGQRVYEGALLRGAGGIATPR